MGNTVKKNLLASAVGVAMLGMGLASLSQAAPSGLSAQHAIAVEASEVGRYIVTFAEPGVMHYQGGVPGLQATAPRAEAGRKFNAKSSEAIAYADHLAQARISHVEDIAQALGKRSSQLKIPHSYSITRNAISIELSPAEAAEVAGLPGVESVSPVRTYELDTFNSPHFIGADKIWDGSAVPSTAVGTDGRGIKVGIIDSGAHIGHPSFDNDASCGFNITNPKLHAVDCTTSSAGTCNGPTPNGIGSGHGVHTGSTAAGNTVNTTFMPAPIVPDGVSMSGVAPCATVYSYKVCEGSCASDAINAAVESIVIDQVDVANFSIGPTCGGGSPWNDTDRGFLDAVAGDVFIAASAGNTRDTCTNPTGLVSHLGPWLMTVAASTQDKLVSPELSVSGPGSPPAILDSVPLNPGSATLVADTVNFSNKKLRVAADIEGCTAFPAGYFANSIAVIRRGTCAFTVKIDNAAAAGAQMVIIANNQSGSLNMNTDAAAAVPAFSVLQTYGDPLISFLQANPWPAGDPDLIFANGFEEIPAGENGAVGDYDRSAIFDRQGDVLADFSFRGPTPGAFADLTKPDITGPGVDIYAAGRVADGNYYSSSGTSMSSPHLAGAAALIRKVQPNWSVAEVKSAIQTTATRNGTKEDGITPWSVDDVGSGGVDLTKATRAGLTLDETPQRFLAANPNGGTVPLTALNLASMRNSQCGASCSFTRTVRNRLNKKGTWTVGVTNPAGYTITASPSTFTLNAGWEQSVTFTATATTPGTPTQVFSFGSVALTETTAQSPVQHLTLALRGGSEPAPGIGGGVVCTTAGVCTFQVDELATSFTGLGCGSWCGMIWLNRFTPDPSDYPITITSISTIFGSGAGWNAAGDKIDVYIYHDNDSDPSNGATVVGTYAGHAMGAPVNSFVTITLPTPIVVNGPGGDILIALSNPYASNVGSRPATMDSGVVGGGARSWIGDNATPGVAPDLSAAGTALEHNVEAGFDKTYLIRAKGTNAGGRPITLGGSGQ